MWRDEQEHASKIVLNGIDKKKKMDQFGMGDDSMVLYGSTFIMFIDYSYTSIEYICSF